MNKEFYRKQVQNQHEKFVVKFEDEVGENVPSRYYIKDAFSHFVFIRVRERHKAQEIVDEVYGKSFYVVRRMGLESNSKGVNAR